MANYLMIPASVKVRLIDMDGSYVTFMARCPVPETSTLPAFDGVISHYKRHFALLCCQDKIRVQIVIYREVEIDPV